MERPPAGTSSETIGIEPSESFEPPTMALDAFPAEPLVWEGDQT